MPENRTPSRQDGTSPQTLILIVTLAASLITLTAFFPYYQRLIAQFCMAINHIAMRLKDENALAELMLTGVMMALKFLITLLPIPCASLAAELLPQCWRKLL